MEMMSAYFPEFSSIESGTVCGWIIQLNGQLAKLNDKKSAAASEAAINMSLK